MSCIYIYIYIYLTFFTFPWLLLQVRSLSRHCQSFFLGNFCLHSLPSFNPSFIFLPEFCSKAQFWSSQSLPHKLSSAPLCLQHKSHALLIAFKTRTNLFRFVQLHSTPYTTLRRDQWFLNIFISGSLYCCCLVAKWCQTLLWPHSLPGSSVHGISQARILEWGAISFSRDLLGPGIECCFVCEFFTTEPPRKPLGTPSSM